MARRRVKVLVGDADGKVLGDLKSNLRKWDFSVTLASTTGQVFQRLKKESPDIALVEIDLFEQDGSSLVDRLRRELPRVQILVTAGQRSQDEAVAAVKAGARDYFIKPIDFATLETDLEKARQEIERRSAASKLVTRFTKDSGFGPFVGTSKGMRRVYDLIKVLSKHETSVLIIGESGTGKELAARSIHELSERRKAKLVSLNAAAMPKDLVESQLFGHVKGAFTGADSARAGCFEMADGGTLFLDEIAEMPASLQPKLLRVLESGRVRPLGSDKEIAFDVRVLAATNRRPKKAIRDGSLREDLYYRLNVFTIELPPLRRRKGDIPLLAHHFVQHFNRRHGFEVEGLSEEALQVLKCHDWPGNVRELRNVVERAVVLTRRGWVETDSLPPLLKQSGGLRTDGSGDQIVIPLGASLADAEKAVLKATLAETGFNKSKTARILGVDVKTVRSKIVHYRLA